MTSLAWETPSASVCVGKLNAYRDTAFGFTRSNGIRYGKTEIWIIDGRRAVCGAEIDHLTANVRNDGLYDLLQIVSCVIGCYGHATSVTALFVACFAH